MKRDAQRPAAENALEDHQTSLDKTVEDSFPTSDPPSTIPDPGAKQAAPGNTLSAIQNDLIQGLPPGSWAAISIDERRVVGRGATQGAAAEDARRAGHTKISLVQVAADQEAPGKTMDIAS
jgi:hypothetical protein